MVMYKQQCYFNFMLIIQSYWSLSSLMDKEIGLHFRLGESVNSSKWRDDEICERGKVLIPEQRQQIIRLEAEVARCYRREKFYTMALAFLLVICGICLFNCIGN